MAEVLLKGVESIEFFKLSENGSFPTEGGVKVVNIEMGSVTINIPALEKTKIEVEDKDGPIAILGQLSDGATMTMNSLDFDPKKAELLFKGDTESTATDGFEFEGKSDIVHLAIAVTSQPYNGKQAVFKFYKAAVTAGVTNPLTKEGFLALSVEAEALTVSKSGGGTIAWSYDIVDVG